MKFLGFFFSFLPRSFISFPSILLFLNGMQTHRRRPSKSILLPRTLGSAPHHHSAYARRMTIHLPESLPDNTHLWGYALLG
ncbi:hypothetical protein BCR42DRAFT_414107, partial [Absidia repens]